MKIFTMRFGVILLFALILASIYQSLQPAQTKTNVNTGYTVNNTRIVCDNIADGGKPLGTLSFGEKELMEKIKSDDKFQITVKNFEFPNQIIRLYTVENRPLGLEASFNYELRRMASCDEAEYRIRDFFVDWGNPKADIGDVYYSAVEWDDNLSNRAFAGFSKYNYAVIIRFFSTCSENSPEICKMIQRQEIERMESLMEELSREQVGKIDGQ